MPVMRSLEGWLIVGADDRMFDYEAIMIAAREGL